MVIEDAKSRREAVGLGGKAKEVREPFFGEEGTDPFSCLISKQEHLFLH